MECTLYAGTLWKENLPLGQMPKWPYMFNYLIYLMSHMTCLNNIRGWSYESPNNVLEEDCSKRFRSKLC